MSTNFLVFFQASRGISFSISFVFFLSKSISINSGSILPIIIGLSILSIIITGLYLSSLNIFKIINLSSFLIFLLSIIFRFFYFFFFSYSLVIILILTKINKFPYTSSLTLLSNKLLELSFNKIIDLIRA